MFFPPNHLEYYKQIYVPVYYRNSKQFRCFTRSVPTRFPNTTVLAPYLSNRIFGYILALQCTTTYLYSKAGLRLAVPVLVRFSMKLDTHTQTFLDSSVAGSFCPFMLVIISLLFCCKFCTKFPSVVFNLICFVRGSFPIFLSSTHSITASYSCSRPPVWEIFKSFSFSFQICQLSYYNVN